VRNKLIAGTVVVALGAGGFVASGAIARPAATYSLSADRSKLKFNKTTIRAKAGSVTLRMSNPSSLSHNIGIKGKGVGRTVGKNGTSTITKRLRKGTYTFYCSVGAHERAGMRGKLIVS
jgi:plastocyanin